MYTYSPSGTGFAISHADGTPLKKMDSEVLAFLYCAERNGAEGYPKRGGEEQFQAYQSRKRAWSAAQLEKAKAPKKAKTPRKRATKKSAAKK